MIIKYYKGFINISTLIDMTKTTKDGTTLYHLKEALLKIGFDAEGIICSFNDLIKNKIPVPCICNCTIDNSYKHFLVIYEVGKDHIIVGDPSCGIKKLTYSNFKKIYNNTLLLAKPNRVIPYIESNDHFTLLKLFIKNKILFKLMIISSLLITILSIIHSFYFGKIVSNIDFDKNVLLFIFFIFLSINITKILLQFIKNKITINLNKLIDLELTNDTVKHILSLPYQYYKNRTVGDIVSRMGDLNKLKDILNRIITSIFIDLPMCVICLVILFKISYLLSFIGLFSVILMALLIMLFKNTNFKVLNKLKILSADANSKIVESLNNFEVLKGLNIEKTVNSKVIKTYITYINYNKKIINLFFIENMFYEVISSIAFLLVGYKGALLVISEKLSLASLITFNTVLNYLFKAVESIMNFSVNLSEFNACLKRINELFIEKKDNGFLNYFQNGDIVFKNLTFSFNDIKNTLNNINLSIKKGSKVLVIGKSGSGKSTLFKLLKGYYKTDLDSIFIADVDINNYKKDILKNNVVYLNQNAEVFNDTILNNISLGNCDNCEFLKITKMCQIDEIANKNSLGYNYILEENGFNLSGGERQRIALARSLLNIKDILIIDEALNQVDIILERKILKRLFGYYQDKTIIIISHRLNNCDLFNQIIELKEGRIIKNVSK